MSVWGTLANGPAELLTKLPDATSSATIPPLARPHHQRRAQRPEFQDQWRSDAVRPRHGDGHHHHGNRRRRFFQRLIAGGAPPLGPALWPFRLRFFRHHPATGKPASPQVRPAVQGHGRLCLPSTAANAFLQRLQQQQLAAAKQNFLTGERINQAPQVIQDVYSNQGIFECRPGRRSRDA